MGPCRESISGRKDLLLSLPKGILLLPLAMLLFFRMPFLHTSPEQTEHLNEASWREAL